eukprot:jgi/Tetstr1/425797/TSEL_001580.t1
MPLRRSASLRARSSAAQVDEAIQGGAVSMAVEASREAASSASAISRMLAPVSVASLVQVGALQAERLGEAGPQAAEPLLAAKALPLLVWQLGAMLEAEDPQGTAQVARALAALTSCGPSFQEATLKVGGMRMLVAAVNWEASLDAATVAAAAISNLVAGNQEAKNKLRVESGLDALVEFMRRAVAAGDAFAVGSAATALRNAITHNNGNREEVTKLDAVKVCIVCICRYCNYEECIVQLLALLNNLFSDNPPAKEQMVEHQGMQALLQLLRLYEDPDQQTVISATRALWGLLMDHVGAQTTFVEENGLDLAVALMQRVEPTSPARTHLLGIICSVTPTAEVARDLAASQGLPTVIAALRAAGDARLVEMAMNAILHLVKPAADPMRDHLRCAGAVEALLELLRCCDPDEELATQALDALLQLLDRNIDAQITLCDAGGVGQLVETLAPAFRPGGCEHPAVARVVWIMFHLADSLEGAELLRRCLAPKLLVRVTMSGLHNPRFPTAPATLPAVATLGRMAAQSKGIREEVLACQAVTGCVRLLQAGVDSELEEMCITTLSSLAEGALGQSLIRKDGGLEYFCRILLTDDLSALEPAVALDAVRAIGHMTLQHRGNQDSMREVGALEALSAILSASHGPGGSRDLLLAALVAIFNMLDANPENQAHAGRCNCAPVLGDILRKSTIEPEELTAFLRQRSRVAQGRRGPVLRENGRGAQDGGGGGGKPALLRRSSKSTLESMWPHGLLPPPCRLKQAAPRVQADGAPARLSLRPSRKLQFTSNASVPLDMLVVPEAISLELPGRLALDCLALMCRARENSDAVRGAGIIPLFVQLLGGAQDNETKTKSAISIAHLAQYSVENQDIMSDAGALERLVESLDRRYTDTVDSECRKWICIALSKVVDGNTRTQEKLGAQGIEAIVGVLRFISEALLEAIEQSTDQALTTNCLSTMKKLSVSPQCRFLSSKHGGSSVVVKLIVNNVDTQGNGELAKVGCDVLTSLAIEEEYKVHAKNAGAISELVRVMRLPASGSVPCEAALAVAKLCEGCKENRVEFRKCLGMRPLVRLLNAGPEAPVTVAGSALISVLAVERENKASRPTHRHYSDVLRNCGAFDALLALIKHGPKSTASVSALRAVSSMCGGHYLNQNSARDAGILPELVRYLDSGHAHAPAVGAAAGAMAALCSAGNATNVEAFREMGGMDVLLNYVKGGLGPAEGSDMAALLAVVTADYPGLKPFAINLDELLSPLIALLSEGGDEEAMGQALNALASMSQKRENYKRAIMAAGAVPHVIRAMNRATNNPNSSVCKHGARLVDCLAADERHVNKWAIKEAGGLVPMLKLLRDAEDPELQLATASGIGHICYGDAASTAPILLRGHGITALTSMLRSGHDRLVTSAALWALRIAAGAPEVVLDLIAAEQGIKHCVRLLTESGSNDSAANAAFILAQFAEYDKKYHDEIFDRKGAEVIISLLRFTQGEFTLKLYLARTLSGLATSVAGKQEIRRAGGISALVDLLEHDCMEASGIDSDITIATTEVLWKLSFDQTNVLRMKDTKLVYLLVKLVAGSDNKQAAFHALCTITIMSEVPSCQQDVIDAGGLRCLVSCVSCVSRFKMNVTAAVALRHFCGDARHRDLIRNAGAFKALCQLIGGLDMEAALEALITAGRLLKPDPLHAVDLVKAGAVQAIKEMYDTKPRTPEIVLGAQALLMLMQDNWEGKRLMLQTGAAEILSVDVLELKATVSAKTLTKVPAEAAAHLSKAPAKSFLNPKSFAAVEEEEEN